MLKQMYAFLLCAIVGGASGCNNTGAPIDAETRKRIDSLSTAQIQTMKLRSDSMCTLSMSTQLPKIVDSLRTLRLQQIEQKMQHTSGTQY